MKRITFTIHDCGCVDVDNNGDSDAFHLISVAWYCLRSINQGLPSPISELEDTEYILEQSKEEKSRIKVCRTRHPNKHAN